MAGHRGSENCGTSTCQAFEPLEAMAGHRGSNTLRPSIFKYFELEAMRVGHSGSETLGTSIVQDFQPPEATTLGHRGGTFYFQEFRTAEANDGRHKRSEKLGIFMFGISNHWRQ